MKRSLTLFLGGLSLLLLASNIEAQVTLRFKDDKVVQAEIIEAGATSFTWKRSIGGPAIVSQYSVLKRAEFPGYEAWDKAEEAYYKGEFKEAGQLYSVVVRDRAKTFYPIPGNFSSLALRRIMDCHKRLLNAEQVSAISGQVASGFSGMPETMRGFTPGEKAWIAFGNQQFDEVIKLGEANKGLKGGDAVDLAYLVGLSQTKKGNDEAALDGYTRAYAFGFGSNAEIAKSSLRASAEIVSRLGDEDRLVELQSQLKIYQQLFGKGKLWNGATPAMIELANAELETLDFSMDGSDTGLAEVPKDLPPIADRGWLLGIEVDRPVYLVGRGEFEMEEKTQPIRQKNDFLFSGKNTMSKGTMRLGDGFFKCQGTILPDEKDGLLLTTGGPDQGCAIYLKDSKVMFAWHSSKKDRKEFTLGPAPVGKETHFIVTVGKELKGGASTGPVKLVSKGEISQGERSDRLTVVIAPDEKQDKVTDHKLGRFKGRIRFLAVGGFKSKTEYANAEKSFFDGKVVLLTPKE